MQFTSVQRMACGDTEDKKKSESITVWVKKNNKKRSDNEAGLTESSFQLTAMNANKKTVAGQQKPEAHHPDTLFDPCRGSASLYTVIYDIVQRTLLPENTEMKLVLTAAPLLNT